MKYGFVDFINLLGALAFFIYGMKIMSEAIQRVAGSKMRQILRSMTSTRTKGVLTGFLVTGLVQSSSATTVLVVSFVNAGLISLIESIGVIMGANIGTTITAWLIAIVGFKVNISSFALPLVGFGFPLLFFAKDQVKSWGEVIIGFALLFMGLGFLKDAVPDLKSNPEILEFLSNYTDLGFLSVILFVLIGTLLTIVFQSSSATMALTLVMANNGWISFDLAAALVLGENIGTTITANLAALVANVHAKRAAFAHFLFNIFGVIWMLFAMSFFVKIIAGYIESTTGSSPLTDSSQIPIALSIFHTSFNIINTLILIWFTRTLAAVVTKIIKATGDEEYSLKYISRGVLSTAELSLEEAQKETAQFGQVVSKMGQIFKDLISEQNPNKQRKLMAKVKKYEEITDQMEEEISGYISKIALGNLSVDSSNRAVALLSVSTELERIGDIYYQMSRDLENKLDSNIKFSKKQSEGLIDMSGLVHEALIIMQANIESGFKKIDISAATLLEDRVDAMRDKMRKDHFKQMARPDFNAKVGSIYHDMFHSLEKIADHANTVSLIISGQNVRTKK